MKTNILSIITIVTALFLSSCEKEIEFNGKETDPKLVINSLVSAGEPVKANISKSYFFLDNNGTTQAPDDVAASLYVNGSLIGEMTSHFDTVWNNGVWHYDEDGNPYHPYRLTTIFTNDYRPQIGDVVKITASANGYDEVEGTTSPLPNAVTCTVVGSKITNWYSWGDDYGDDNEKDSVLHTDYNLEVTIEITDPNPGKTDFFRISADRGSLYADDGMNYASYFAQYNDPIFTSLTSTDNDFVDFSDLNLTPEGVFTDLLFDGKSYQLKIPFSVSIVKYDDADPDFFRIAFTVEHLSREYYNYLNTCNQGDDFMQIWAEPIQTYSNVKNGYGLVGSRTVDTLWVPLPTEE
ncbi:MAG: DUF4249 domain-containing protein [Bacteroidales bacterium]|nr:DUF4249 domain-containing protein [Bacteroidales bacterium]